MSIESKGGDSASLERLIMDGGEVGEVSEILLGCCPTICPSFLPQDGSLVLHQQGSVAEFLS